MQVCVLGGSDELVNFHLFFFFLVYAVAESVVG